MPSRTATSPCDVEALARAIEPFMTGPKFLIYGDKMVKTPLKKAELKKHKELWNVMANLNEKLDFVQKDVAAALVNVHEKIGEAWEKKGENG